MAKLRPNTLLLLLLAMVLLLCFRGWPSADGSYFLRETETFLAQGSLGRAEIGERESEFYFKGSDDRYYGRTNESAMILTLTPFVGVGKALEAMLPDSLGSTALYFTVSLHSVFFALLAAWLTLLVARAMGFDGRTARLAALLLIISTPMLHYSGRLFRDPMVVAAQLFVCLTLLNWLNEGGWRRGLWLALSLALLGWVRVPNGVLMGFVTLLLAFGQWRRLSIGVLATILGLGAAFALRMLWAKLVIGDAIGAPTASNLATTLEGIFLNVDGTKGAGATIPEAHWWLPLSRMVGMLVAPGAGMLFFMPMVMLGGVVIWRRRDSAHRPARLGWLILVYSILGYSLFSAWFSGSWGVRYLLPAAALPIIFAADWLRLSLQSRSLRLLIISVALAIGVLGTLVNDRPSVAGAPSEDPSVTRRDQVWQPSAFPLYHHTKRALAPDWSPIARDDLAKGYTSAKRQVLAGYVVWWAVAIRAGMAWVIALPLLLLLGIGLCAWRLLRLKPTPEEQGQY